MADCRNWPKALSLSLSLSSTLLATSLATGALMGFGASCLAPSDASATTVTTATSQQDVSATEISWNSTDKNITGITIDDATGTTSGVYAAQGSEDGDAITIILDTGHTIIISASSTQSGSLKFYGINAERTSNTIENKGTIDVTATLDLTSNSANAYGMCAYKTDSTNNLTNSATIDVTATNIATGPAYGYGMYAGGATNTITNKADAEITVIASSISNSATAYGMYAGGATNTITNKADAEITVIASSISNSAYAYGMYASGSANTLSNFGIMTVTANPLDEDDAPTGGGSVRAYGMYVGGAGVSKNITNEAGAEITVMASSTGGSAEANGIYAYSYATHELTNNGTINVTASTTSYGASAYGMRNEDTSSATTFTNTLTNNDTINVTASSTGGSAVANGMYVDSLGTHELTNNGTMNVTAESTGGNAYATGMSVVGGTSTLNNYGIIDVSATAGGDKTATAYQAYVEEGTGNIGTWNMLLGEDYGANGYYVFGVEDGATLNFGVEDAGATFIFYNMGDAFVDGGSYAVSDMVNAIGSATVTGYIGEVQSSYEFLEVELVDSEGNAFDLTSITDNTWESQYIKGTLAVTEGNSPTQAVANQTMSSMSANLNQVRTIVSGQTRSVGQKFGFGGQGFGKQDGAKQGGDGEGKPHGMGATGTLYADASSTVTDAGTSYINPAQDAPLWTAFAMPYYSQSGANNNAYDGHMAGIAMGATRQMSDDFSLGMHAAFSKGSGDSDLTDSDATAYTLGVHAVYNVGDSLFFRGQLSGFTSKSELDMIGSSEGLTRANADMDTHGLYAMVGAGYDYVLATDGHGAPQHVLTPELGLSYFYAHMDGFDTAFYNTSTGASADSFGMDSEDYDVFYADATVRWTGLFDMDKGVLKPTVKVGIRQALSDPEISSTMQFGNATATTYADANATAFLCEAGLAWEVGDVGVSLTYSGEFGDEEYSHMGMFKVEWAF